MRLLSTHDHKQNITSSGKLTTVMNSETKITIQTIDLLKCSGNVNPLQSNTRTLFAYFFIHVTNF